MRQARLWIVALLGGVLLAAGCSTLPSPGPDAAGEDEEALPVPRRASQRPVKSEAHAHYGTAVIHEMNGQTDAAMEEFYQAASKDPDDEGLTLEVASRLVQNERLPRALELLQASVKRPAASGAIYARLGLVYARLDRKAEALTANQMAVKKSPRLLAGYRQIYLIHAQARDATAALRILDQATSSANTGAGFLIGLAGLYASHAQQFPSQRQSVNAKALTVLNRAEQLKPASTHLRLQLADGFFLVDRMDKAATHYLDVLDELDELPQARELVRDRLMKIYLREGDRQRAREQLEAMTRDNPANAQAHYFLGLIAYEEQRWENMADCLKKTLLFRPNFEPAYYDLATAQIAAGKSDEALATLGTAKQKFPPNFKVEYGLGMANQQARNFKQAVNHFTTAEMLARATDTNLLTHGFYYQMGAACQRAGDLAQAKDCFEKCLALSPDFEAAYYDLANVLLALGRANEAVAALETARGRFHPNFVLEYLFGAVERQRKNHAGAIRHFLAAEALAQTTDTNRLTHFFYFDLGATYERNGEHAHAEAAFEKCLVLEPDFPEAQNYLGYMLAERGEQLERARDLIERALRAQPRNAAYLDSMAWVLFKLNRPREALEHQLKAVALSQEPDATLFDHLGEIYAALNEMEQARDAWRKSLETEPNAAVQKKLDDFSRP